MNLKTIDQNIGLILKSGVELNELIQKVAVAIVLHASVHGDCTRALKLVQAMPKSFRRNLLITWFATYSPIGMNLSTGKCGLHRETSKLYRPFDVDGAKITPWYNQPQAAEEDALDTTLEDVKTATSRLAKRYQKQLDEGTVANDDIPAVTAMVATLTAAAA